MYETVSDLTAKNIDTQQLLGLIKNKEINDEFAYEDDSEAEDGKQVWTCNASDLVEYSDYKTKVYLKCTNAQNIITRIK